MGGKSKRYFQGRVRSRSRSPERDSHRPPASYQGGSSKQSNSKSSRSHYEQSSYKYSDNKLSSDRLRQTIQEQLKSTTKPLSTKEKEKALPVEEQLKRANAIDEINYNPFVPKSFRSNRNTNFTGNSINLLDIPLPIDGNSWRENPKLLINPSLYIGNSEDRKQKWYENLQAMRKS